MLNKENTGGSDIRNFCVVDVESAVGVASNIHVIIGVCGYQGAPFFLRTPIGL